MSSFARWIDENNARLGQDKRRESIRAQLYEEQTTPVGVWVWPCTIIPARYGGVYEGGKWIGVGDSPQAALDDLKRKMLKR